MEMKQRVIFLFLTSDFTRENLATLRKESKRLEDMQNKSTTVTVGDDEEEKGEMTPESEISDEEEFVAEIKPSSKTMPKQPRASVSAEAFGAWNKKSDFQPRVVEKSPEMNQKIHDRLRGAFMF